MKARSTQRWTTISSTMTRFKTRSKWLPIWWDALLSSKFSGVPSMIWSPWRSPPGNWLVVPDMRDLPKFTMDHHGSLPTMGNHHHLGGIYKDIYIHTDVYPVLVAGFSCISRLREIWNDLTCPTLVGNQLGGSSQLEIGFIALVFGRSPIALFLANLPMITRSHEHLGHLGLKENLPSGYLT